MAGPADPRSEDLFIADPFSDLELRDDLVVVKPRPGLPPPKRTFVSFDDSALPEAVDELIITGVDIFSGIIRQLMF